MKCPNCDFDCPPEMRFCGMCGSPLTIICSECQFTNPITYRFCGMCGNLLQQDEGSARPRGAGAARAAAAPRPLGLQMAASSQSHPPTGQASLPNSPAPLQTNVTSLADGERRIASVIFVDVKGSTELLEHLGTEAWVEVMNNIFQVLESEIYRYRGEVSQFRGDGLVALFGAKTASEDDPEHAVMAALAMQEAIKPYAAELTRKEGIELVLRIGVNTGDIIVTNVGDSAQYSEDTVMGEALTVASRMETAAEPGTVLVSESTYRLTMAAFEWLALGDIMVKGISHPIAVYRPLALKPATEIGPEPQMPGFAHGLIGRKNEFQILKQSVEDLDAGRGGIVQVTSVRGMGKSFLVDQVRQHFVRQNALRAVVHTMEPSRPATNSEDHLVQPINWLQARCRSYGQLRPYSMWLDLMQGWLGTHPGTRSPEVQAILRAQIEAQWGSDVEHYYPNLASFLSGPIDEMATERVRHLDAESLKRQFFLTTRQLILDLVPDGPLVISFSDMQWADPTSLELLEYCLPLSDTETILWVLVYRPDRESPVWDLHHRLETIYPHRLIHLPLPPFTVEESNEFIDQFMGPDVLFPETRALIIQKSEGNPYFIKELVFTLIAQGALVQDNERAWQQTRAVTSLDLPDSLQNLLVARLDRLSPSERRILQMAAVIGSIFWLNALQALSSQSISFPHLQQDMVALQRAGLIHERVFVPDLGMEYAFDSSLIREVAYESLLSTQRVAYHLQVAEYLEEIVFREGKKRYFNILAHHYRLAGDVKKELFYTLQAAERAQSIYANTEALHYYTRSIELLDRLKSQVSNGHQKYAILTQKFEALAGRRAVNYLMGNVEAGVADAHALLALARQMEKDPTWLIDALLQQPGVSGITSGDSREEVERGVPLATEALALAQKIGDKRREMNCWITIATQRNLLNDPTWMEVGDKALFLAREIGDHQYEAMILLGIGHAFIGRDELNKGSEYLNAALPIARELKDRTIELTLLTVLSAQFERSGDHYKRLVEYEQKRLEVAREIGHRLEEGNSLLFCGQIQGLNLGDLAGGIARVQEARQILSVVSGKLFPLLRIAQMQIALGQFEEARDTLKEAKPDAERNVYELGRVGWLMISVLLHNALDDEGHFRLAIETTAQINAMQEKQLISRQYRMAAACHAAEAHLGLARLLTNEQERQEHQNKALESSQIAVETYETFGYVNIVECACEEVYLRHSQALAANGQQAKASEYLDNAYNEMMRKYEMIPVESPFRRTYLENIAYHREIRAARMAATTLIKPGSR